MRYDEIRWGKRYLIYTHKSHVVIEYCMIMVKYQYMAVFQDEIN